MSRMGTVWLMRNAFQQARQSMEAQRRWCAAGDERQPYPFDLANEGLIALLMGQARLHNHCYMVHDFQAVLRLTREFGYTVSAFHHSLEAWKIPDVLKNITIATWAGQTPHSPAQHSDSTRRAYAHLFRALWCVQTGGASRQRRTTAACMHRYDYTRQVCQ